MAETNDQADRYAADVAAVGRISAVPTILDVVCRATGMGFAAVARVTEDRWIACSVRDEIAFGLKPGGELKVESTICHEIRQHRQPVVINNVAEDPQWRNHHTPIQYGLQSYISMPIILPDGRFFGTLCAIDPRPAKVNTPEIIGMFRMFAELIGFHLDSQKKLEASEARLEASQLSLGDERRTSALREQFIAVLGHDLRNPLAAVDAGMSMLARTQLDAKATTVLAMMKNSVTRMSGLIDNVLDFARGRLGDGIVLQRKTTPVAPVLTQVIEELRAGSPDRAIETEFDLDRPVSIDPARIGQLFSNLLANALTHGAPDKPVRVTASTANEKFELVVANAGAPIPSDVMVRLFQPFARGEVRDTLKGLGLGLYISTEIARAHGGTLSVASNDAETRFTFTLSSP